MAGGLLNLVSQGQQNIILNGNPSKTFWKATYKKYTNFGKQNFRLDFEGTPTLNLTTESTYTFKVKRYADLLMDTYLSFTHGDTIILGFSNEVVREREGAELFFKTYQNNNTDIYGEVSVAYNDNNFTVVGLLTSNETTFDIGLLNTSNPIKLVKIEFFITISCTP